MRKFNIRWQLVIYDIVIFVERDAPLSREEIDKRLTVLRRACESEDDAAAWEALREAVPSFRNPEEVNQRAEEATEMRNRREAALT